LERTEGPRKEGARESAEFRETEAPDPDLEKIPEETPLGRIREGNAREVPSGFRVSELPPNADIDFDPDFDSNDLNRRVVIRVFPPAEDRICAESRRILTPDEIPLRPDNADPVPRDGYVRNDGTERAFRRGLAVLPERLPLDVNSRIPEVFPLEERTVRRPDRDVVFPPEGALRPEPRTRGRASG